MMPHFVYVRICSLFNTHEWTELLKAAHTNRDWCVSLWIHTFQPPQTANTPPVEGVDLSLCYLLCISVHACCMAGLCSSELVICEGLCRYVLWRQNAWVYV
jgi:hypothetical protein